MEQNRLLDEVVSMKLFQGNFNLQAVSYKQAGQERCLSAPSAKDGADGRGRLLPSQFALSTTVVSWRAQPPFYYMKSGLK